MPERVAHILADYANEVRKLAYTLPSGVAETEALRLSKPNGQRRRPVAQQKSRRTQPPAVRRPVPLKHLPALGRPRPGMLRAVPARQNPSEG